MRSLFATAWHGKARKAKGGHMGRPVA